MAAPCFDRDRVDGRHWIMDAEHNLTPVSFNDWVDWWMEHIEQPSDLSIIGRFEQGDVRVSTVFLALNYQFEPGGEPLLFETMVFGGPLDQETEHYSTWAQALAGHEAWVIRVGAPR